MNTRFFRFTLLVLFLAGCGQMKDRSDTSVVVSEEYQKNGFTVVDVIVKNCEVGAFEYACIYFIMNKALPIGSVATFYDKEDRVLRKKEVGESDAMSRFYRIDNPSFQYSLSANIDSRLITKIIIGQQ